MAVNKSVVAKLQLPEGYTVRKVKDVLKVVAKPRKAVVAEEIVSENKNWDDWAEVLEASQKEKIVNDIVIPFGKHRGQKMSQIDREYLVWLQDLDRNPKPIIKDGINWTELAIQELSRRRQAIKQEIEEAPSVFSYLPNTVIDETVRILADELVAHLKAGNAVNMSNSNEVENMLRKSGYRGTKVSILQTDIWVRASLIMEGKLPQYDSKGSRVN